MRLLSATQYFFGRALRQGGVRLGADDARVRAMQYEIRRLGGKIEFKIEQYPDGSWTAESTNIDGIITGGKTVKYMPTMMKDAIFTYFGIPPHYCDDALLRADNEPVTLRQFVYV